MLIRLPWIEPIDALALPENFEELVKKSFSDFTSGRAKDYRFQDKLLYLDNLRMLLYPENSSDAVTALIGEKVKSELEASREMPDAEDILSVDFMKECYKAGFKPMHACFEKNSTSLNDLTLKAIFKIVQIVINYEDDDI